MNTLVKRGRPTKEKDVVETFNPESIRIVYNKQLNFSDALFEPLKTESELDMMKLFWDFVNIKKIELGYTDTIFIHWTHAEKIFYNK